MNKVQLTRHEPLHLKYRPQSLNELVGQDAVTRTLTNAIEHSRLSHAYLFTGPRGTGKTSSARILAKSLNCIAFDKPTAKPCQKCTNCLEITNSTSPAVFEIDAASNNSVEDARILIERAPLVAVGGRFKIYIIDECHMLSKEAFNALLKTLEEPPNNVVFVLATTEEHKVLPTIISRCQRLMFRLINQESLTTHLEEIAQKENINISKEALEFIARRSGGGLRDALSLLELASLMNTDDKPISINDLLVLIGSLSEDVLLELSNYILERQGNLVLNLTKRLLMEGRQPITITQELCRHYLNLVKASYVVDATNNSSEHLLTQLIEGSKEYIQGLYKQAPLYDKAEVSQILAELNKLETTLRYSTQAQINLEIGLLSICHRLNMTLFKDLNERLIRLEQMSGQINTNLPIKPEPVKLPAPDNSIKQSEKTEEPEDLEEVKENTQKIQEEKPLISEVIHETNISTDNEISEELEVSDIDIDLIWSKILDELQRRHIPTYSLASTHAFPLSLIANKLTLGVMVEGFKNLLEKKIEHLNLACQTIGEGSISIQIKVAPKNNSQANKSESNKNKTKEIENKVESKPEEHKPPQENKQPQEAKPINKPAEKPTDESNSVKEAYKIFDGPGSRLIN
jgi:DNA polymerase-3 subunit gamma/tau